MALTNNQKRRIVYYLRACGQDGCKVSTVHDAICKNVVGATQSMTAAWVKKVAKAKMFTRPPRYVLDEDKATMALAALNDEQEAHQGDTSEMQLELPGW